MAEPLRIASPCDIRLVESSFDPGSPLALFADAHAGSGAIGSFIGQVRAAGGVDALELTHYAPLTLPEIVRLGKDVHRRFALDGLLAWHRIGVMQPGAAIVLVAAAAPHRRTAFDAVECMMDHLKCAAWLWKRERRADGWHWIEPRTEDRTAFARWDRRV